MNQTTQNFVAVVVVVRGRRFARCSGVEVVGAATRIDPAAIYRRCRRRPKYRLDA